MSAMQAADDNDPVTYLLLLGEVHGFDVEFLDDLDKSSRLRTVVVTATSSLEDSSSAAKVSMAAAPAAKASTAEAVRKRSSVWASKELARRDAAHLLLNDATFQKTFGILPNRRWNGWCPCSRCR